MQAGTGCGWPNLDYAAHTEGDNVCETETQRGRKRCVESTKDSQLTSARKIHTNAKSPRVAYSKSSPGMRANTRYTNCTRSTSA